MPIGKAISHVSRIVVNDTRIVSHSLSPTTSDTGS
jgi:hypothetical protein